MCGNEGNYKKCDFVVKYSDEHYKHLGVGFSAKKTVKIGIAKIVFGLANF
jgi:hypothetical protein